MSTDKTKITFYADADVAEWLAKCEPGTTSKTLNKVLRAYFSSNPDDKLFWQPVQPFAGVQLDQAAVADILALYRPSPDTELEAMKASLARVEAIIDRLDLDQSKKKKSK